MKKVVRLTESDIVRLVKKIVKEQNQSNSNSCEKRLYENKIQIPESCKDYSKINTDVQSVKKCFTDVRKLKDDPKMTEVQKKEIEQFIVCTTTKLGNL
jgi:hypothetical protein